MKDIIKKLLKEDDLDWIGSVSNDYWDYYDAVVFKKTLFDDEFKKFINQALKSVQPTNASDWEEDDEMRSKGDTRSSLVVSLFESSVVLKATHP